MFDTSPGAVQTMLIFLYTFEPPKFTINRDAESYEAARNDLWVTAVEVYLIACKYDLPSLSDCVYDVLLLHAWKLFRRWERCKDDERLDRIEIVRDVWKWHGVGAEDVKAKILKGLLGVADSVTACPKMQQLLRKDRAFMLDYVMALSKKVAKRRFVSANTGETLAQPIEIY